MAFHSDAITAAARSNAGRTCCAAWQLLAASGAPPDLQSAGALYYFGTMIAAGLFRGFPRYLLSAGHRVCHRAAAVAGPARQAGRTHPRLSRWTPPKPDPRHEHCRQPARVVPPAIQTPISRISAGARRQHPLPRLEPLMPNASCCSSMARRPTRALVGPHRAVCRPRPSRGRDRPVRPWPKRLARHTPWPTGRKRSRA